MEVTVPIKWTNERAYEKPKCYWKLKKKRLPKKKITGSTTIKNMAKDTVIKDVAEENTPALGRDTQGSLHPRG